MRRRGKEEKQISFNKNKCISKGAPRHTPLYVTNPVVAGPGHARTRSPSGRRSRPGTPFATSEIYLSAEVRPPARLATRRRPRPPQATVSVGWLRRGRASWIPPTFLPAARSLAPSPMRRGMRKRARERLSFSSFFLLVLLLKALFLAGRPPMRKRHFQIRHRHLNVMTLNTNLSIC